MHQAISSAIQLFPSSNAATATAAACITIMSSLEPARTSPAPLYYTIVPQTKSQHARCDNNTVRRDASHHVHEIGLHFDVMSRTHMSEQSALVVSELCCGIMCHSSLTTCSGECEQNGKLCCPRVTWKITLSRSVVAQ